MASDGDAADVEEPFGDGAGRDPGGGFAGAGPLQDVAGVLAVVFQNADQVGVAGPGSGYLAAAGFVGGLGGHDVGPVGPIPVFDQHGDWGAKGGTGSDAGEELDLVLFDLHPGAAAVAPHPAGEVVVDPGGVEGEAGGDAFDEGDESFAVGFAGGREAEVHGG